MILLAGLVVAVGSVASLVQAANRWFDVVDRRPPRPTGHRAVGDRIGTAVMVLGLLSWAAVAAALIGLSTPPVRRWMMSGETILNQFGGGPFSLWFGLLFGAGGVVCLAVGLWMKVEAWDPDDPYGPD